MRERDRERERGREGERVRERDRQSGTEEDTESEREREIKKDRNRLTVIIERKRIDNRQFCLYIYKEIRVNFDDSRVCMSMYR